MSATTKKKSKKSKKSASKLVLTDRDVLEARREREAARREREAQGLAGFSEEFQIFDPKIAKFLYDLKARVNDLECKIECLAENG